MGNHYVRRFDLSKYTLKSFDSADEFCADINNSDQWTYNANGTTAILANNIASGQSVPTPFVETASVTNGGTIPGVQGGPVTATTLIKQVTAIANNTATAVYTVTVPNSESAAILAVSLLGVEGAGGAVSEGESSATGYGQIVLARTAGVNVVATAATITNTAVATVAGGNALSTIAYAVSSISGAVGAVNTFTVNVTIAVSAGSATNHICIAEAVLYNFKGSGVTIA